MQADIRLPYLFFDDVASLPNERAMSGHRSFTASSFHGLSDWKLRSSVILEHLGLPITGWNHSRTEHTLRPGAHRPRARQKLTSRGYAVRLFRLLHQLRLFLKYTSARSCTLYLFRKAPVCHTRCQQTLTHPVTKISKFLFACPFLSTCHPTSSRRSHGITRSHIAPVICNPCLCSIF